MPATKTYILMSNFNPSMRYGLCMYLWTTQRSFFISEWSEWYFRYCGLDKFRGLDNWLQVSQWKFELFPVVCIRDRPADLDNHWEGSMWWERTHNLLGIVCEIAWGHFLSCFCEIGWSFLHGHCDTWKVVYFLVGLHSCKEIGFDVIIGPA